MIDLYCPPPGAMQFEVTRSPKGPLEKPFAIWVEREPVEWLSERQTPDCTCLKPYRVLQGVAPTGVPKTNLDRLSEGVDVFICDCSGRIIE